MGSEMCIRDRTQLDRRLTEQNCRKDWFEIRLRLIAAYLLSGNRKRGENLAKGLEASADEAQDFLTMRRLKQLLDSTNTVSPIAALAVPTNLESDDEVSASVIDSSEESEEEEETTPLAEVLTEYMQRIMQVHEDDEARQQLLHDFLSHSPEQIESEKDAAYLVHLSQFIIQGTDDALLVWPWAEKMIQCFPDDPIVMSVVATLGHYFRMADTPNFEAITLEQLEKWFRMSTTPKAVSYTHLTLPMIYSV